MSRSRSIAAVCRGSPSNGFRPRSASLERPSIITRMPGVTVRPGSGQHSWEGFALVIGTTWDSMP